MNGCCPYNSLSLTCLVSGATSYLKHRLITRLQSDLMTPRFTPASFLSTSSGGRQPGFVRVWEMRCQHLRSASSWQPLPPRAKPQPSPSTLCHISHPKEARTHCHRCEGEVSVMGCLEICRWVNRNKSPYLFKVLLLSGQIKSGFHLICTAHKNIKTWRWRVLLLWSRDYHSDIWSKCEAKNKTARTASVYINRLHCPSHVHLHHRLTTDLISPLKCHKNITENIVTNDAHDDIQQLCSY